MCMANHIFSGMKMDTSGKRKSKHDMRKGCIEAREHKEHIECAENTKKTCREHRECAENMQRTQRTCRKPREHAENPENMQRTCREPRKSAENTKNVQRTQRMCSCILGRPSAPSNLCGPDPHIVS